MRPSEANSAEEYIEMCRLRAACAKCGPLLQALQERENHFDSESALLKRIMANHDCRAEQ